MFINPWEKQQYPPKVILINEAIIELLSDGKDIGSLKVSEITQKAGIGKGTAYEYFSNKEEMIASALEYNLARLLENLIERERDAADFRDVLWRMIEWMTDNFRNNAGFMMLLKTTGMSGEMPAEMVAEIQKRCAKKKDAIARMIQQALLIGEEEGTIRKMHPYYGSAALLSQIMAYALYLSDKELSAQVPEQDAKNFLVESIIKMLN